jgi:hypothetical protein
MSFKVQSICYSNWELVVIRLVDLMSPDSLVNQLMTCLFSSTNLVLSIHSLELILRFHTLTVNHGFKQTVYRQL